MTTTDFQLRVASWDGDRDAIRAVRFPVFVEEQAVPEEMEWDSDDADALHLLAEDGDGRPIGTARLLPSGQIGRMAVLRQWQGKGVGSALLRRLLEEGRGLGHPPPFLNAQVQAIPFYRRHGFEPLGDVFDEAGIPHRRMERPPTAGTPYRVHPDGRKAFRGHALALVRSARRRIDILSHDLEPALYDQAPFLEAVQAFSTGSHRRQVRILLRDNALAQGRGHRLLELARRLPSRIAIHRPAGEDDERHDAFLVVDADRLLHRPIHALYQGEAVYGDRRRAGALAAEFDGMWGRSRGDSDLRRLDI